MIKINEITRPNSNRIIDNMGFIRNNYTGKLIINYEVIYPKSLIKENIEILKKILI
jgi:DnaJ-class molecular chaperone